MSQGRIIHFCAIAVAIACTAIFTAPARAALPMGDIVFIVDESASMQDEINDVRRNISEIAGEVSERIDARYALVGFGGASPGRVRDEPFTRTEFTDTQGLTTALRGTEASSGPGGS